MQVFLVLMAIGTLFLSGCATDTPARLHHQKKAGLSGEALEYHRQGDQFRQAGNIAKAIESYKEAIRLQPDHPGSYNSLGYTYLNAGRLQEAKTAFEEAIRLEPRFACPHFGLFRYYMAIGNEKAAMAEFDIFARFDPKSAREILEDAKKHKESTEQK